MNKTIEEAAKEFADREYEIGQVDWDALYKGYYHGMKDALGKQEKDADTVISGWIARDANPHSLYIYGREPVRLSNMWSALGRSFAIQIGSTMFPDLTWDSGPEPVEIIIKRKKK